MQKKAAQNRINKAPALHIPELDGLRVLFVFIVSWYHFWQQSWLTPRIGSVSLDFLLRAGYMMVDGTILLSGFLLFLPHARAMLLEEPVPGLRRFYEKRVMRILPSYWFVTLLLLFAVAIPYNRYATSAGMWRDLLMHLSFTQTFHPATYINTPLGVASWTIAIEMQAYLIFPLLAKWARKRPAVTLLGMTGAAFLFRAWCLTGLTDYNMVVNQLPNFLDVYAIGMAAALLYVRLSCRYPKEGKGRLCWNLTATAAVAAAGAALVRLLKAQAATVGTAGIQAGQMLRRPFLALILTVVLLALPFAVRPLRVLFGNRVTGFLAAVSMNYYLMHQNIAVHLKRIGFPPSQVFPNPNMAPGGPEQPWADQYTALCFGLSLITAAAITWLVEKPCARLLDGLFKKCDKKAEK